MCRCGRVWVSGISIPVWVLPLVPDFQTEKWQVQAKGERCKLFQYMREVCGAPWGALCCRQSRFSACSHAGSVSGGRTASCFESGRAKPLCGRCPWALKLETGLTLQEFAAKEKRPGALLTTGCRRAVTFCEGLSELSFSWNGKKTEQYQHFYWGKWKIKLPEVNQNVSPLLASDCFEW